MLYTTNRLSTWVRSSTVQSSSRDSLQFLALLLAPSEPYSNVSVWDLIPVPFIFYPLLTRYIHCVILAHHCNYCISFLIIITLVLVLVPVVYSNRSFTLLFSNGRCYFPHIQPIIITALIIVFILFLFFVQIIIAIFTELMLFDYRTVLHSIGIRSFLLLIF